MSKRFTKRNGSPVQAPSASPQSFHAFRTALYASCFGDKRRTRLTLLFALLILLGIAAGTYQYRILKLNHRRAYVHYQQANDLFHQGKADAAAAEYQSALLLDPLFAEAHNNYGIVLFQKGEIDEAIDEYQKALQIHSNYTEAHNNLGVLLSKEKRWDEAIKQYRQTLDLDPDYVGARNNLAVALFNNGQTDEAVAQLEEAVRRNPTNVDAQKNLARVKAILQSAPASK